MARSTNQILFAMILLLAVAHCCVAQISGGITFEGGSDLETALSPQELTVRLGPLSQITLGADFVPPGAQLPTNRYESQQETPPARPMGVYSWEASALFHRPLYFEDVDLERYGHRHRLQPIHSGVRFFVSAALLPYKMGLDFPHEHDYILGYDRPGNCTPAVREHLPLRLHALAMELGVVTGLALMF